MTPYIEDIRRAIFIVASSYYKDHGVQFFFTHSPQPHLDGGYTVFARVTGGMEVVDRLARGDKILSVVVLE